MRSARQLLATTRCGPRSSRPAMRSGSTLNTTGRLVPKASSMSLPIALLIRRCEHGGGRRFERRAAGGHGLPSGVGEGADLLQQPVEEVLATAGPSRRAARRRAISTARRLARSAHALSAASRSRAMAAFAAASSAAASFAASRSRAACACSAVSCAALRMASRSRAKPARVRAMSASAAAASARFASASAKASAPCRAARRSWRRPAARRSARAARSGSGH